MVRKKLRTGFLLFKKILRVRKKVRTQILLSKKKKSHGKAKGKSPILTFEKKKTTHIVIKR